MSFNCPKFELTKAQFSDVFIEAIDNWEIFFNCLRNERDNADMFQALSILIMFSKSLYIEKAVGMVSL